MKILVVISKFFPEFTGAAHRTINTYNRLNKKNIEIEIICNSGGISKSRFYKYKSYKIHLINSEFKNFYLRSYSIILKTFFILIKKKYNLLHIIGNSPSVMASILFSKIFN